MPSTVKGIYLNDSLWDTIKEESERQERSVSWIISKIVKDWIENNKTKDKKARAQTIRKDNNNESRFL